MNRSGSWPQLVVAELATTIQTGPRPADSRPADSLAQPRERGVTLPVRVRGCCRRTELAAALRLAGRLHRTGNGQITLLAELDHSGAARAVQAALAAVSPLLGTGPAEVITVPGRCSDVGGAARSLVGVTAGAATLARWTGLAETMSLPHGGLPRFVVTGPDCCAAASWRGGFLAAGTLTRPGRPGPAALAITCPTTAAALAFTGTARRLGLHPTIAAGRGATTAVVHGDTEINALLRRIGAPRAAADWTAARRRHRAQTGQHLTNQRGVGFTTANTARSRQAAATTITRLRAALAALGEENIPGHLAAAANLRIAHPTLSLGQLADLADPPLTKDTLATRIHRLLRQADPPPPPP